MELTPDTKHSIVITKTLSYRGTTRRWSNRYHFEGDLPPDSAHWDTFADAITAAEKVLYDSDLQIVEAVGYDASTATPTNPHGIAVYTKTYALAGTGNYAATGNQAPGDCAGMIRYDTNARSHKNHPVYLFNYYHGVYIEAGGVDSVNHDQLAAYNTYADHWVSGFSDGSENHERCGPRGAVSTGANADPHIRHRDFPN